MSERLKGLREKRGKIVTEMRGIIDAAEKDKRELSPEESTKHGELFKTQEGLRVQIEAEERQVELDRQMAAAEGKRAEAKGGNADGGENRAMIAFRNFLRTGTIMGDGVEELRALQASSNPEGGFLVAPQEFVETLIKAVDNATFIRARATKFTVARATSLGAVSLDADPDDADWTSELGTGSEDSAMAFGKRELHPRPVAKRLKVSKKLLRQLPAVESLVISRLAYKFGVTQEKAFLLGSGANRPLGVFVASNDGIPTGRDVSTGNTTTAIAFDNLMAVKFAVKAQYWPKADWLFHRDAVLKITQLKDSNGQYLWRQSVREGEPDTLLGRPLMISEYAPNTFAASQYVGLFGDFSQYWIADALDMQVQRLVELYAETNQDGFIGRLESDGMPVLSEAFARVQLAAA